MNTPTLESRIYGCWLGKSIGGTLGIPAEGRTERLNFTFYDPIPETAPPNDDLELQLVWLHLLETRGFELTQGDLAEGWLNHIHYMWDEYGRCRWNLRRGVPPSESGAFENHFGDSMGSPIRSEIWACVAGGQARLAAGYAALDASLDHGPEGIAGEVFNAVHQTLVLGGATIPDALKQARAWVDDATETAKALDLVFEHHADGLEAWACRQKLLDAHEKPNFTYAPLNVALTMWALLYGDGDFHTSILLGVNCGYDTDCTAATSGATLGLFLGRENIPEKWAAPIGDGVEIGPGIIDANVPTTLGELSDRTLALLEQLRALPEKPKLELPPSTGQVDKDKLAGRIEVTPLDGGAPVHWSNGDLPASVKRAGGASWTWTPDSQNGVAMRLMALAPEGAKLSVDGEVIVDCPVGAPFTPSPHRMVAGSIESFVAQKPSYEVKLELASNDEDQRAEVILASPNFHIAPWTGEQLPFEPQLD